MAQILFCGLNVSIFCKYNIRIIKTKYFYLKEKSIYLLVMQHCACKKLFILLIFTEAMCKLYSEGADVQDTSTNKGQ